MELNGPRLVSRFESVEFLPTRRESLPAKESTSDGRRGGGGMEGVGVGWADACPQQRSNWRMLMSNHREHSTWYAPR